ncbi:MAG TPA: hypothetical protein VIV60_36630 [Polyangiaceae bacterium]
MMQQLLEIIGSAGFAATLVALIRKQIPAIDRYAVYVTYAIVMGATWAISHYAARIPPEIMQALVVLAGLLAGPGAVTLAQQIAAKGKGSTVQLQVIDPSATPVDNPSK